MILFVASPSLNLMTYLIRILLAINNFTIVCDIFTIVVLCTGFLTLFFRYYLLVFSTSNTTSIYWYLLFKNILLVFLFSYFLQFYILTLTLHGYTLL
jgi:hypothetical protein